MDGRETGEKRDVVIEPRENGPYRIRNLGRLENSKGERLTTKEVVSLCRCGGSSNKPFCDGTHYRNGFSSANVSDRSVDRRITYVGARLKIHDNRGICSHAGHCTGGLPAVFNSERMPWIDPDGAPPEAVVEVVKRCPSGALSYSIDGVERRDQEREPMVLVSKDGPYYVTGGIALEDAPWGEEASREHYALCRCGGSKNKPFCDGTHWSIGFEDEKN